MLQVCDKSLSRFHGFNCIYKHMHLHKVPPYC